MDSERLEGGQGYGTDPKRSSENRLLRVIKKRIRNFLNPPPDSELYGIYYLDHPPGSTYSPPKE